MDNRDGFFEVTSDFGNTIISQPVNQIEGSFSNDVVFGMDDVYERIIFQGGINTVTTGLGQDTIEIDIDEWQINSSHQQD